MEDSGQTSQKPKPRPKPRVTANMLRTKINPNYVNWNKSAMNNKMSSEQSSNELPARSRPPIKPKPQCLSIGIAPKHQPIIELSSIQVNGATDESSDDNCFCTIHPTHDNRILQSPTAKNKPPLPTPRKNRIDSSPECLEDDLNEKSSGTTSTGITSFTWSDTTNDIISIVNRLKLVPPTLPKPFSKLDMSSSSQGCVTRNPLKLNPSYLDRQPVANFSVVEINISNNDCSFECSTSLTKDNRDITNTIKSNLISVVENENIIETSCPLIFHEKRTCDKDSIISNNSEFSDLQNTFFSKDNKTTKENNCSDITKEKANSFPKFSSSNAGRLRKFSAGSNVAEIAKRFDSILPSRKSSLVQSFPALPTNWLDDRSKETNNFKNSITNVFKGDGESDKSSKSDSTCSLLADNIVDNSELSVTSTLDEKPQEKDESVNKLNEIFTQGTQNSRHITVITIGFSEKKCIEENLDKSLILASKGYQSNSTLDKFQKNLKSNIDLNVENQDSHYSVIDESDRGEFNQLAKTEDQKAIEQSLFPTNAKQDVSNNPVKNNQQLHLDNKSLKIDRRTHRRQRSYSDTAQIIFMNQLEMETESNMTFGTESDTGHEDDIYTDVFISNSDHVIKGCSDGKASTDESENAWIDLGDDKKEQMHQGRSSSSRRKNYKKRINTHKKSTRLKMPSKPDDTLNDEDKNASNSTETTGRKQSPSDNSDAWVTESDSESTSSFEHIYEMIQEERQPKPPQRTSSLRESKDTSSSPDYGTDSQESGSDQPWRISKAAFRVAQEKKKKMLLSSLGDFPSQIAAKLTKIKPRVNSFGAADVTEQKDSFVPPETNLRDFKKIMRSHFIKNKSTPNLYSKLKDPESDQISYNSTCDSPMLSRNSIPTEANETLTFTPLTTPKLSAKHDSRRWVDVNDVKKALMNRRQSTPITSSEVISSIVFDTNNQTSITSGNRPYSECEQPPLPPPRITFRSNKDKMRRITTDVSGFIFKSQSPQLPRTNVKSAVVNSQDVFGNNHSSTMLIPPNAFNETGDNSPLRNCDHIQRLNNLLSKSSITTQTNITEKVASTGSLPPDLPVRRRSRENSSSPFRESQIDNSQNSEKTPPLKPRQRRTSIGVGDEIVCPPSPKSSATDSGIDATDTISSAGSTSAEDGASNFSDENFLSPQPSPLRHNKKKKSKLESEPLYQYYNCDVIRRAFEEKNHSTNEQGGVTKQELTYPKSSLLLLQKSECKGGHRTLWCELQEVRQSGILDIIKPQDRKLQEAMFEVITSEAAYLKSLNILVNNFLMAPEFSSEHSTRCVLERRDKHCLFSNIVAVRDVSERFLADLEARWQESVVISDVCDIVALNAENYFAVYVKYCANQIYQDRILKKLKNRNPEFVEALRRLEANPECQSLDMQSFLMLPMQRITRLPLLIDAVFHRLEPGSPKFDTAKEAMRILTKIVKECNEGARKMEQMEELCKIEQQLDFREIKKIPLVSAARYLVKKGDLIRISPESTIKLPFGKNRPSKHSVYLFLFNDLLVVSKRKSEENYIVVDYCPRNFIQAESIENPDSCTWLPTGVPDGCKHLLLLTMLQNHEQKMVEMVLACNLESNCMRWKEAMTPASSENPNEKIYEEWDCPQVQAIHLYIPKQPDELGLEESDIVNVFRKVADGWYEGERIRDGEKGWFPANHTVEIVSSHIRAKNLRQRYRLLAASESYLQTQRRIKK